MVNVGLGRLISCCRARYPWSLFTPGHPHFDQWWGIQVVTMAVWPLCTMFVVSMRVSQQLFIWKSFWITRLTLHADDAELYISIQWQIIHSLLIYAFQWICGWYRNHYWYPEEFFSQLFRVLCQFLCGRNGSHVKCMVIMIRDYEGTPYIEQPFRSLIIM